MQLVRQQKSEEGAAELVKWEPQQRLQKKQISERCQKGRMLGMTHTEEEHEENLISFIRKYELKEKRFQENEKH